MEMLDQKQKIILIIIIAVVVCVVGYYYMNSTKDTYSVIDSAVSENQEDTETQEEQEEATKQIVVHIAGAVENSGVVEVDANARINDVIEAAGGLSEDADISNVNLAYTVEDGQKIYIPSIDDDETTIVSDGAGSGVIGESEDEDGLININKATLTELMNIPGVGEATATKIIEYRNSNGNFDTIEDIKNVSGIGDAKFESMKDYITV